MAAPRRCFISATFCAMDPIYLDYNATTPIAPEVADAMLPFLRTHFGNPSSGHAFGLTARRAVEQARSQVAAMLGCDADEVLFTSGGSESNNLAIKGALGALGLERSGHVITSAVEHPAVTAVCAHLQRRGCRVTTLPVDGRGLLDPRTLEREITDDTALVSVMHANNEVGTIQPIRALADIAHSHGALMHSDCAQSVGKVPVGVNELGVDLLSVAGHKLYAPKGVGALYVRRGVELEPLIHGADHERGLRAGTENLLLDVGLGAACELVSSHLEREQPRLAALRDRLERALRGHCPDLQLNGHLERRLPNTSSASFPGQVASDLLSAMPGLAASAGAACHSEGVSVSSVLQAMGLDEARALGTLRFSVGRFTTEEEVDRAMELVGEGLKRG